MDNCCFGEWANAHSTSGENCVVIGDSANAYANNCLVIGDDVAVTEDDQCVAGESLFDEPIPERVKTMVEQYGPELHWLLQVVCRRIVAGLQDGAE